MFEQDLVMQCHSGKINKKKFMDNTVLGYLRLQTKDFYKMLKAIARKKKNTVHFATGLALSEFD